MSSLWLTSACGLSLVESSRRLSLTALEPLADIFGLLLGWIPVLLGLICARITLEFYVVMARTAQNTRAEPERIRSMIG